MRDWATRDGATWWTHGAQGGVGQPPYVVRWHGRWWRTLPLKDTTGGPSMGQTMAAWVHSLPPIENGLRLVLDYFARTGKHLSDLPLLYAPPVAEPVYPRTSKLQLLVCKRMLASMLVKHGEVPDPRLAELRPVTVAEVLDRATEIVRWTPLPPLTDREVDGVIKAYLTRKEAR